MSLKTLFVRKVRIYTQKAYFLGKKLRSALIMCFDTFILHNLFRQAHFWQKVNNILQRILTIAFTQRIVIATFTSLNTFWHEKIILDKRLRKNRIPDWYPIFIKKKRKRNDKGSKKGWRITCQSSLWQIKFPEKLQGTKPFKHFSF